MNVSLYQAAAALSANSRWQEVISENLAAGSIPGYKKQDLSFSAIQAGMMPAGSATGASNRYVLPQVQQVTSFQQGELKMTGVKTDVALDGKGFFEVQLPNGSRAYTRDGEFQINSQGQLSTKQGYPVLGEAGPIQLDRNNGAPLNITATGEVSQGADTKGKLRVMGFNQPQQLTAISGGYFIADKSSILGNPIDNPTVRQGYLESSNISTMTEMASLIGVMRTFEANQRIVQMQDERMGKAISELGNPS